MDIKLNDLTMQDMLFQAAIDLVVSKLGAPKAEASWGCKWDTIELLYSSGTITMQAHGPKDCGKYVIKKIQDVEIFLASVIPQNVWYNLTVSIDLLYWMNKQLDSCNIRYTRTLRTYHIYTTAKMYDMIVEYAKRIANVSAYN
jgi:hypothetical protein